MGTNETKEMVELYLNEVGKKYDKSASVKFKSQSRLLRLLHPILKIFNKNYWNGYVTTVGSTIYVPDNWFDRGDIKSRLQIIAHEVVHIMQHKKQTALVHGFLYLFPQILAPLTLLSFLAISFGLGWLWCLLFLVFLTPLPAPFRYMKELEAYRVKILFCKHAYKSSPELMQWAKNGIIRNLSKSDYYFCWPFPKQIQKNLDKSEQMFDKSVYKEILDFLKRHDLLSKQKSD